MLSLYATGLLIAGGFTGVLITVAFAPKPVKQLFNKCLWGNEND